VQLFTLALLVVWMLTLETWRLGATEKYCIIVICPVKTSQTFENARFCIEMTLILGITVKNKCYD
jgi:hypothetical protein